ncbi:MAG: RNA-binding S4 domain-containing protein [Calditrichaeota bacterium]|nr:RNA-binding S4 domain-containing protein [Calditrichota bacterium]
MKTKEPTERSPESQMRLDKWLKVARIFKTRSQASEACEQRRVKVNGQTVKPAKAVRVGDEVTIRFGKRFRTLHIQEITQRSLPAARARELYREEKPELSEESLEMLELIKKLDRKFRPKSKGRPTKKERRQLEKLRGF